MIQPEAFDLESGFHNRKKFPLLHHRVGASVILIPAMIIAVLLFAVGCVHKEGCDFSAVERIVSTAPKAALDSLRAIDYNSLSEPDRHYYDFLLIKARDKAYVKHRSDSLILDVIDYYESHDDRNLYPEALYYGGRVYSDIGDYPTALRYFQQALDKYPDGSIDLVRSNILSQTGGLLQEMELPLEAIPYLEKAVEIGMVLRDTVNLVYDHQLLGSIYMAGRMFDKAARQFDEAYAWAGIVSDPRYSNQLKGNVRAYMATLMRQRGNLDSAMTLVHGLEGQVEPEYRNFAFISAAHIYLRANKFDSAYKYARLLVEQRDTNNRELGYRVLLNPKLRNLVTADSLMSYVMKYRDILEDYREHHQLQQLFVQNARYNYMVQERRRAEAERRSSRLAVISLALGLAVAVCVCLILYRRVRWQRQRMELDEAHDIIRQLREGMKTPDGERNSERDNSNSDNSDRSNKSNKELRAALRESVLAACREAGRPVGVPEGVAKSEAYATLRTLIDEGKAIPDGSPLWKELERAVESDSPSFRRNLEILSGGKLTANDWHVALLIRCGVRPTQMANVFSRTKSTVSHYRSKLLSLVLDPADLDPDTADSDTTDMDTANGGAASVDDIIRLL